MATKEFVLLADLTHACKDLHNFGLYILQKEYAEHKRFMPLAELFQVVKGLEAYQALSSNHAQQVLRILIQNYRSFFALLQKWKCDPSSVRERPQPRVSWQRTGILLPAL